MKVLSRDFTTKEKILLLVLVVILLALTYYQFFYKPVSSAISKANSEKVNLETELTTLEAKIANLKKMQEELDSIENLGNVKPMPSYNNVKRINTLLNNVLGPLEYSISFGNATRSGDQIRRNVTMSYRAPDFATMEKVLIDILNSDYRCLIDDLNISIGQTEVSASTTITFYETMVGGQADIVLPQ